MTKVVTKKNQKILTKFLVGIILLAIGIYGQSKSSGDVKLDTSQSGYYDVVSIADGDTITVNMEGKKEKIRFIGVDTPEVYHGGDTAPSECYADQAKEFVASGIDNKRVKLVADDKGSNRDKYGTCPSSSHQKTYPSPLWSSRDARRCQPHELFHGPQPHR